MSHERQGGARLLVEHFALGQLWEIVVVAVVADDTRGRNAEHGAVGEVRAGGGATI